VVDAAGHLDGRLGQRREMTLLAGQTALWLGLGLPAGLLLVIAVLALVAIASVVFDGDAEDIADVQRFIALTEEARRLVPPGLPLFDGEKAASATAAIVRFQAKKDEARRSLWASRDRRRTMANADTPATRRSPSGTPTEESGALPRHH
jgi:hypothetical protein